MPARPPAGVARRTEGYHRARRLRETFTGLPEPFRTKWCAYRAIVRAGVARPIGDGATHTLFLLIEATREADWQPGHEPVVWLGNAELAGLRGKTVPTIERHLAELERAGLIERRYPRSRRRILSLAPMVEVALVLHRAGVAARERRRTIAQRAFDVSETAGNLAGVRAAAETLGLSGAERDELAALEQQVRHAHHELRRLRRHDGAAGPERRAAHDRMAEGNAEGAVAAGRMASELVDRHVDYSPMLPSPLRGSAHENATLIPTTESEEDSVSTPWSDRPEATGRAVAGKVIVDDATLRALSPLYADWCPSLEGPLDDRLATIGWIACAGIGYPRHRYQEACRRHGVAKAALAALAVRQKPLSALRRRNPAAYLHGMFTKPTAELNPLASLYAARKALEDRSEERPWTP